MEVQQSGQRLGLVREGQGSPHFLSPQLPTWCWASSSVAAGAAGLVLCWILGVWHALWGCVSSVNICGMNEENALALEILSYLRDRFISPISWMRK